MKKTISILLSVFLSLSIVFAQDARQRSVETIVSDVLAAMPAAATMILCGSGSAFAATANPLTANESPVTGWVFAGIIGTAAVAGVLYFIFSGKKK